jgi:hypothetical protein
MPRKPEPYSKKDRMLKWTRFLAAVLALLVAATHFAYAVPASGPAPAPTSHTANQTTTAPSRSSSSSAFAAPTLWFDIEVIAYTVIAVVYLLGIRTWYAASLGFNAFNVVLYFASGIVAIPGITSRPFGSRLNGLLSGSLNTEVLMISWVALLIVGILLMKYDPGSALDGLLATKKGKDAKA